MTCSYIGQQLVYWA